MRVTSVRINKLKGGGSILALASIILDDAICINKIEIVRRNNETFISFPIKISRSRKKYTIAHPINIEIKEKIQNAILQEYKEICNKG